MICNLSAILDNKLAVNQKALCELFELFTLYEINENYSSYLLKVVVYKS